MGSGGKDRVGVEIEAGMTPRKSMAEEEILCRLRQRTFLTEQSQVRENVLNHFLEPVLHRDGTKCHI